MHNLPPIHYRNRRDLPGKAEVLLNRVTLNLGDANKAHHNIADLEEMEAVLSAHFGGALEIPAIWRRLISGYTAAALAIANI